MGDKRSKKDKAKVDRQKNAKTAEASRQNQLKQPAALPKPVNH